MAPAPPCSICRKTIKLNKDGKVRRHRYPDTQETCPGSGQPPAAGVYWPVDTPAETWKWIPQGSYEDRG
jgi:hypothetical protein